MLALLVMIVAGGMSESDHFVQLCKAILVERFCSKVTHDISLKGVKGVHRDIS